MAVILMMGLTLSPAQVAAHDGEARFHFKTEAAEVRFEATDPDTGIVTSVWVYAADDALPERISKLVVAVDQYDPTACAVSDVDVEAEPGGGCMRFSAECYAELGDDAFWVDPHQLDSATVAGRVPCFEKVTGSQIQLPSG